MTTMFAVGRSDLRRTHWRETAQAPLAPGEARLRIDLFALTSNNVTYGAFGESMHYWDFFPTGDADSGCIPVWGFATVSESLVDGVDVGERFYGYWPMADEVVLSPVRVIAAGFFDGAPRRRDLPEIYNRYLRCSEDPLYRREHEALMALLQPLFITSFLIDDFLADNAFFGAKTLLVSSASSKTAYGLAFCLARRRGGSGMPKVVGLTSPANLAFTRGLGCYDEVVAYDDVTTLPAGDPAVYVDMSGDATLRVAVHDRWGEQLAYSCSVGGTHWQALGGGKGLAGPRPVLFFAPAQIKKRVAEWGATGLQQGMASAWQGFIERVAEPRAPWLRVVVASGREAVETTYSALLAGTVAAEEGRVLAL
ncbi:MAG TPA: DUF2855 family protein [Caldimonas sp.]|jgi:hypothetical protein|nr:DUF2855 family protein [Caldimonas sp.]